MSPPSSWPPTAMTELDNGHPLTACAREFATTDVVRRMWLPPLTPAAVAQERRRGRGRGPALPEDGGERVLCGRGPRRLR